MPRRPTRLKGVHRPWPAPLLLPAGAGAPPRPEARLLALTGDVHCTGPWTMPPRFAVKAFLTDLVLDLREVVIPPDATLDVDTVLAQVTIILPPGVLVTVLASDGAGDVSDRRPAADRGLGGRESTRLVLTAFVLFASIELVGG